MKPMFAARASRRFTLHTGPTNSGKTHAALLRLGEAASGVYAAPLRLLAREAFESLNASGTPTTLLTGQERVVVPNATHISCTVEMFPGAQHYELGVLDEVQLVSDRDRGFAWTRAIMEGDCDEIILCGQATATPLLRRVIESKSAQRTVTEKSFERFNRLVVEESAAVSFFIHASMLCLHY